MTTQSPPAHPTRGVRWWTGRILLAGLALVLVVGVIIWLAGSSAKTSLVKRYPPPGQLVNVGEYKMHIHCIGQGSPTVILEAGLDDFSIFWSLVQPKVGKFTRVCAYDRAGYGWSELGPHSRTSETMMQELHTLLVNAGVDQPYVLVGHSFGGVLVRQYASSYPGQVVGMVLVDAANSELFARIPAWSRAIEQKLGLYRTLAPLSTYGVLALMQDSTPTRGLPDDALAQYRAILATTGYFETAIAETESFESNVAEISAADHAGFGDMPLIVLSRGVWDTPLPGVSETENQQAWQAWQAMQSELTALSSNSKQVIAEQSGHWIQLDQPQLVVEAIWEIVLATHK